MTTAVVDTNVVLVANQQHQGVSPDCIRICALRLQEITREGRLALDDAFLILSEYQNKTDAKRGKGPGDAFVKWALRNSANTARCDRIAIKPHAQRGFESFPDDARLANFDAPDRKFVAVAAAHPDQPPVLQAADSKWIDWEPALKDHGVSVQFICERDIQRFHQNKFGA
jgi:hypothetical protein